MNQCFLVVDDNSGIRTLCKELFKECKFNLIEACDGDQALEIFNASSPILVILDAKMPGKNGIKVAVEMKIINPSVLIILITAYPRSPDVIEAVKNKWIDSFLSKPFDLEQLHQTVCGLVHKIIPCNNINTGLKKLCTDNSTNRI